MLEPIYSGGKWGREVFWDFMIMSQYFNGPVFLGCDLHRGGRSGKSALPQLGSGSGELSSSGSSPLLWRVLWACYTVSTLFFLLTEQQGGLFWLFTMTAYSVPTGKFPRIWAGHHNFAVPGVSHSQACPHSAHSNSSIFCPHKQFLAMTPWIHLSH